MERDRLEHRVKWREEFEDPTLLALQARELFLKGLRRLTLRLEKLKYLFF